MYGPAADVKEKSFV